MRHRFSKYEGLGNDFLVVEQAQFAPLNAELARRLCDRHFGVGADGVLLTGAPEGRPFMRVINADGSRPEMCGNGLRCVALYLCERGLVRERTFEVDTDAGVHRVRVLDPSGSEQAGRRQLEVQMRPASLEAGEVLRDVCGPFLNQRFELDGEQLEVSAVSMGNPHLVLFADVLARAAELGPRLERDPRFRAGVNVGFARLRDRENLELTVWERGVGFTLACGTGACAAAVAAVETGRVARHVPLSVHLPGGALSICVGERAAPIAMTGPARRVFEGELDLG